MLSSQHVNFVYIFKKSILFIYYKKPKCTGTFIWTLCVWTVIDGKNSAGKRLQLQQFGEIEKRLPVVVFEEGSNGSMYALLALARYIFHLKYTTLCFYVSRKTNSYVLSTLNKKREKRPLKHTQKNYLVCYWYKKY